MLEASQCKGTACLSQCTADDVFDRRQPMQSWKCRRCRHDALVFRRERGEEGEGVIYLFYEHAAKDRVSPRPVFLMHVNWNFLFLP